MLRRSSAMLITVVLVVGVAAAGCSTYRTASGQVATPASTTTKTTGDVGMSGMMGMMSGTRQTVTSAKARALTRQSESNTMIDATAKTITYRGQQVQIIALATPDMSWYIDGLVNPTLVIPRNAFVTVRVINTDPEHPHGWELTTATPPYSLMPMMSGNTAFPGAFAMPLGGATAQHWPVRSVSFTAESGGMYYYLCPVPGHAQRGMFGKLIVR